MVEAKKNVYPSSMVLFLDPGSWINKQDPQHCVPTNYFKFKESITSKQTRNEKFTTEFRIKCIISEFVCSRTESAALETGILKRPRIEKYRISKIYNNIKNTYHESAVFN